MQPRRRVSQRDKIERAGASAVGGPPSPPRGSLRFHVSRDSCVRASEATSSKGVGVGLSLGEQTGWWHGGMVALVALWGTLRHSGGLVVGSCPSIHGVDLVK